MVQQVGACDLAVHVHVAMVQQRRLAVVLVLEHAARQLQRLSLSHFDALG